MFFLWWVRAGQRKSRARANNRPRRTRVQWPRRFKTRTSQPAASSPLGVLNVMPTLTAEIAASHHLVHTQLAKEARFGCFLAAWDRQHYDTPTADSSCSQHEIEVHSCEGGENGQTANSRGCCTNAAPEVALRRASQLLRSELCMRFLSLMLLLTLSPACFKAASSGLPSRLALASRSPAGRV